MRVRLFGRLRDGLGSELDLAMPGACSIAEVRAFIAAGFPHAEAVGHASTRACVDDEIVPEGFIVQPDQVVEFLPTVSGG